jgi:hypothetical protein
MSIDIHQALSKLPFGTTAYKEMHYVLPNGPASFAGPLTKLDIRLNADDSWKEWSKPKNQVDEACYHHDLDYRDAGDDLIKKHDADRLLLEALQQISPSTFSEKVMKFIIDKIIRLKLKLGMGLIEDEAKQVAEELHKPARKHYQRRMVIVKYVDEIHCCDLINIDPPEIGKNHVKYNYVLTYMDLFSRYAWAFALRNKSADELLKCLKSVWQTNKPIKLWSDKESGLYSKQAEKFFKDNNVELYSTESEIKCGPIERFNRTLKERMETRRTEYTILNKPFKFLQHLPVVINDYNNTIHRSLGITPTEATKKENESIVQNAFMQKYNSILSEKPKFKVGDAVRIYRYKYHFDKGYKQRWTDEIFFVKEVHKSKPITYSLIDDKEEVIKGRFYSYELQKTATLNS